jgi:hypothetical protein
MITAMGPASGLIMAIPAVRGPSVRINKTSARVGTHITTAK